MQGSRTLEILAEIKQMINVSQDLDYLVATVGPMLDELEEQERNSIELINGLVADFYSERGVLK